MKIHQTINVTTIIVCPKLNIHPQTIQDVDEFVFSSDQIWRNVALHHSEWVPSE